MMVIIFYFNNEAQEKAHDGRYVKHDRLAMSTLVAPLYFLSEK